MKNTHRYLYDLLGFFYPKICPGCGMPLRQNEEILCLFCVFKLPKTGLKNGESNPVNNIFKGRISLVQADAWLFFRKKGITQRMMHELKYKGNSDLGIYLGRQYGKDLVGRKDVIRPDIITTVPLHPDKLKVRGFNQSELIGAGISEAMNVRFEPGIIRRTENTATQTRKRRYERWENSKESFEVSLAENQLPGHIAIVDDVITTGSTLEACALTLMEKGCRQISFFSLCLAIN